MPDLSLLLACTQCSDVPAKLTQHCQDIRINETTPAKSDMSDCVSEPESMELAFSPPVNQETSPKKPQEVEQKNLQKQQLLTENNNYHNNYAEAVEYRPVNMEMLLSTGGFLCLFAIGGIFLVWKRFPEAQRQWQLMLQGDAGIFGSGLPIPKDKEAKKEEFDQPVILQQSRAWSHAIVWSIVGVSTFAVVWASTAKIDESVPVQGKLEPKGFVKDIQAPVGGVIDKIHVQEGQRVKKGDLLVSFDRTTTQAKLKSLEAVRASLLAENQFYQSQMRSPTANSSTAQLKELPELAALTENRAALIQENQLFRAELNEGSGIRDLNPRYRQRLLTRQLERETRIESVRLDREQLTRQLNQIQVQLINARGSLRTNSEIAHNLESLVEKGAFARLPYLEKRQAADASQAEVNRLVQEQERLKLAIAQGQKKLENAIALSKEDLLSRIADNEKRIADIDSQLTKVIIENQKKVQEINSELSELQLNMKYQELRAADDGIVFDLKPRSSGYVYNSSETILKIVPPDNLVAQVYITNNDIGFVKAGMPVDVRIDSFPYTEFSDIKGQLVRIGSDALPPDQTHPYYRFSAEIRLDKQSLNVNGTEVPLQSGMSLNANINLRKRTVMSIFTDKFLGKVESLKYTR
ncbi:MULTISPECIES: HlyD family efflux transporter periplasmic adaptor subunit [Calothrix]|uniref:HlyD family efflux transporter periplasmic adaptor subunit n=2 Tax=Calothrix TaxID=1186 RepID=A0ABR8AKF4_9CYAN|nr:MULTISPECIES: HlyD family efflux transporter periplasmic adaptor subunit [Calothrix]MBD2199166.1 HlyD family efflux transporter periplasmic adaptor subunit [Calothrix parietina FACHB-288]MBD2227868.1 HlyD family efflux transporter periplasmic adaptor subunit [Calothrix anomala FACHB-343]